MCGSVCIESDVSFLPTEGVTSPSKALMTNLDALKRTLDQLDLTLSSRMQEVLPRDLAQVEAQVLKHKVCSLDCIGLSCPMSWTKTPTVAQVEGAGYKVLCAVSVV